MDPYYPPAHFQAFRAEDPRNATYTRSTSSGCIQHIGKDTRQVPTFSSSIQGYAAASHNIPLASQTRPRTIRLIMSPPFEKCTSLTTGESFIKAWFEVVTCHAFLWKNRVEYGDLSLSSMMYDPVAECGVLTDFDLVLLQWELRAIGTDRTRTMAFMAIGLLSKYYWNGIRQRYYYHELESFLWMLPFLFLSYNDGERKPNQYIDSWRTSDYATCRKNKSDFLHNPSLRLDAQPTVQPNYKDFWPWVSKIFSFLRQEHSARTDRHEDTGNEHGNRTHKKDSEEAWLSFVSALEDLHKTPLGFKGFTDVLKQLELVRPTFDNLSDEVKASLCRQYKDFGRQYL